MVPNGTQWYRMVPNGTKWFSILNNIKWYQIIPNGNQWSQMVPHDNQWLTIGTKWYPMVISHTNESIYVGTVVKLGSGRSNFRLDTLDNENAWIIQHL